MNSSLLVLCLGCSGFADCLLPLPQLLTFPVDHERDGVELALLREAVDLRLTLYKQCLERKDKFSSKLHPLCARLPSAVSQAFNTSSHRRSFLRFRTVDNESSTPPCTPTLMRCRRQVRHDAIPKLSPLMIAPRAAVSQNLPSTQTKLSANSLQMQPFVS